MSKEIRVVVTGMGAISPLGNNVEDTWKALISGKSGIKRVSKEDESGFRIDGVNSEVDIAGVVENFEPADFLSFKELKKAHMSAIFSYAASVEALKDAGLFADSLTNIDPERIGARIGTGVGGGSEIAEVEDVIINKGDQKISPFSMLRLLSERVVTVSSMKLGIKGPISAVVAACATGSIAIGDAVDKIRLGKADAMLAGGTEAAIHRVGVGSFHAMHALSTDNENPEFASRPFNENVSGFVMAEGAGILVLESLDHVIARGAENQIYAEVLGNADTSDAYHDTQPSGDGAVRAMRIAMKESGINPSEVNYINAHGTSTPLGDEKELEAIVRVFGDELKHISISSTKSATGHLLGAAGGLEAVICVKAICTDLVPPTLNLENPIVAGLDLVPNKYKKRIVNIAMSNSFGFGGINSVLIFGKYKGGSNGKVA